MIGAWRVRHAEPGADGSAPGRSERPTLTPRTSVQVRCLPAYATGCSRDRFANPGAQGEHNDAQLSTTRDKVKCSNPGFEILLDPLRPCSR